MTGNDFKAWRKRLDLTQAQAADLLGESLRTIQTWEARGEQDLRRLVGYACQWLAELRKPDQEN